MAVEGTEPRTGFPISIEGTFGLVVEVVLALLEHLHIKEPLIIWGLFIFGLALVVHAVIRYSGTNRRRLPQDDPSRVIVLSIRMVGTLQNEARGSTEKRCRQSKSKPIAASSPHCDPTEHQRSRRTD